MQKTGIKAVSVAGFLLIALLAGCSKGNTASTDSGGSSSQQLNSPVALAATVTGADGIVIDDYTPVSSTRISRTVFEYAYKADVSNWGTGDAALTASLASTAANVTVVQANLDFGDVPEGDTKQSLGTFVVRVDRSQPFDDSALIWTVQATPLAPTTYALIDNAVASGAIDAETGLVYKVYHDFRDSRLPAQYVGREDPTSSRESYAIQDVMLNFGTLSPSTQDLLRPFLLPPDDPASWYQLRLSQQSAQGAAVTALSTAAAATATPTPTAAGACSPSPFPDLEGAILTRNGKVCVHYWGTAVYSAGTTTADGLKAEAQGLADEIDNIIWPRLTALFGEPPMDSGGQLNIYIQAGEALEVSGGITGVLGLTFSPVCGPEARPYIYIEHGIRELFETAAHEMTHAINHRIPTGSCNTGDYWWLAEATASWAEHFVYPGHQSEQGYAHSFLNVPAVSLETRGNNHEYGAYLLFLYMTKGDSLSPDANTELVQAVWDSLGAGADVLHAIDSVIGGLRQKWHDFALYDWNRYMDMSKYPVISIPDSICNQPGQPYAYYANWDCLKTRAKESPSPNPTVVKLNGQVAAMYPLTHKINHLAAKYFHYDFTQDNTIRRVRLLNPYSGNTAGNVKVQAIVKTDSGWLKAQDWTGFQQKTLCRDKTDEKFRELVIVISNSEFEDRNFVLQDDGAAQPVQTKLQVSALGCSNWKGSVKTSYVSGNVNDDVSSKMDAEDVTFEYQKDLEKWTDTDDTQAFKVTGGSVSWKSDETLNIGVTCTGSFSGTYSLANTTLDEATLTLGVNGKPDYAIDALMLPVANGGSWTVDPFAYQLTCQDLGSFQPYAFLIVNEWFSVYKNNNGQSFQILPGIYDTAGGLFDGELAGFATLFTQSPGEEYDYLWELKKNGTFDSDQ